VWSADDGNVYDWLKRSIFRIESQPSIEGITDTYCDFYFDHSTKNGFEALRDFLERRLNTEINTDTARSEIRTEGKLKLKDYALDATLPQRMRDATASYLDTYTPFGAGNEVIPRQEAEQLAAKCLDSNGPTVLLLTGVAGAGKSGVVRELIARLSFGSAPHLAFRVDHHLDCKSPQSFGKAITNREESPVATLKGTSADRRSVLIVDQVDAVSEISGRNGATKQAVLRLVDDARNFGNVVVVICCRTFDLENDERLKALKDSHGVEHIDVQLLDWEANVKPLLTSKAIASDLFSESQIELLRLPLNLALFIETYDPKSPFFTSRSELFRRLLEKKRISIEADSSINWGLIQPISRLAEWMSEQQRLDAPETILSPFARALSILPSEGLIVRSKGNINFFHESFFDYIYALTFSERDLSLEALLLQTEQHLFRRTQVRQILENLRQSDRARYLRELCSVFGNTKVRYHIQVAVAQWLGSQADPWPEERDILLSIDTSIGSFPALLRLAFFTSPGWFDRLHTDGWIEKQISGGNAERAETVLWWLSNIAASRPSEIATLLAKWWGKDKERGARLLNWFGFVKRQKPDDALVDLCAEVTRSSPPGMFEGRGHTSRDLLLHTWAGDNPRGAEKVLKAYFDAWFEAHPGQHPFERDEFRDLDAHSMGELAKKAPEVFVQGTIEAFVRSVQMIQQANSNGTNDYSFGIRVASGHHFGADAFLNMFRSALGEVAAKAPDDAAAALRKIDASIHPVNAHLWLETIGRNGEALKALFVEILNCKHVFDAGWQGADWQSLATAAKAALPHLTAHEVAQFDDLIARHNPELDFASRLLQKISMDGEEPPWRTPSSVSYYLKRSGHDVWCILESIGGAALSATSRVRLEELRRKFGAEKLPEPHHAEAHWVQSPIKRESAARMTDGQWLSAIQKYDSDEHRRYGRTFVEGGARQLATELQNLAKEQPSRFAAFSENIPQDAPDTYLNHLLWGLAEAEQIAIEDVKRAILAAHRRHERAHGSDIARLIEKKPEVARDPEVFEVLAWYIENGHADEREDVDHSNTEREITSVEDLISQGRIHIRGVNSARGAAAEALGQVLWHVPEVIEQSWLILERRSVDEALVSVRCCLVRAALPLYNSDKSRCAKLINEIAQPRGATITPTFLHKVWLRAAFPSNCLPSVAKMFSIKTAYLVERALRRRAITLDEDTNAYWLAPLLTHHGVRLLPYIIHWEPSVGKFVLCRMIVEGDENTRMVAAWLVFWQSFQNEEFIPLADALALDGVVYRRILADVASHAIEDHELRHRAEAILCRSFNDKDKQVRGQAADVFRRAKPNEFDRYRDLASQFIRSRAFESGSYAFFHALEEAESKVVDLVVQATEILIDDIEKNGNAAGRRSMDLHQIVDIIKNEYTASDSNPVVRGKLLDLIDRMMKMELYGIDAIVNAHER
jgi:hypothetical protein